METAKVTALTEKELDEFLREAINELRQRLKPLEGRLIAIRLAQELADKLSIPSFHNTLYELFCESMGIPSRNAKHQWMDKEPQ